MFSLFSDKRYLKSKNKAIYEEVATMFSVRPQRVYKLAHGKEANTRKDQQIVQVLLKKGIIKRVDQ